MLRATVKFGEEERVIFSANGTPMPWQAGKRVVVATTSPRK
ncbi:MAG: hypothetical protein ACLSG1_02880 [Anaerotignum faecicola]